MTKKPVGKLAPRRVLKTAQELLITYIQNYPGELNARHIYGAIETLGMFTDQKTKPYEWIGNGKPKEKPKK